MYEVELKVRADHDRVRERLDAQGATRVGRVQQTDTYYDAPHRDFAETDEALRIRREARDGDGGGGDGEAAGASETATRLTYKGPLVEAASKTREEAETGVGDAEAARAVLEGLGFQPAATVRKDRDRYRLEGYTVALDAVEGLGEFVEVETEVREEAEVEPAREGAETLLEGLGLDPGDGIRTSYLGLLLEAERAARDDDGGTTGGDNGGGTTGGDDGGGTTGGEEGGDASGISRD